MKALVLAIALALASALPVTAAEPLTLAVYAGCTSPRGTLWEIEASGSGWVDVSLAPGFSRRTTRSIHVTTGDTFAWFRSTTIYVRQHGDTNVVVGTADGTPC